MGVFAFLDILGFTNYVKNNQVSAANMLYDLSSVLANSSTSLANFDEFFSGSDSLFISATNIDLLTTGISEFLNECFTLYASAHQYPSNPSSPTEVEITDIKMENGQVVQKQITTFWPPLLFRGGISSLGTSNIKVENIENKKVIMQRNIIGTGVIDAINIEGLGFSGPRVFLSDKFDRNLIQPNTLINVSYDRPNFLELYWPAYRIHVTNPLNNIMINEFRQMMQVAVNLWDASNHFSFGHHYYQLIKLIVQSFRLTLIPAYGDSLVTNTMIQELRKYPTLSLKINDLLY